MLHKHRGWWAFAVVVGAVLPALFAEAPTAPTPAARTEPEAKKLDLLKLPPDAILIICDEAKEAANLAPRSVRMTPEKYQELQDQIKNLEAKLKQADKPLTPSTCQLKGRIEGNYLLLEAQFEFKTDLPNTVVWLASAPAMPTGIQLLDERTPQFKAEANGCSVQIDKPGPHTLTLALKLELTAKAADRGFELELPRAAITHLELALPDGVKDVRVGGKPVADDHYLTLKNGQLSGDLSSTDKLLDVKWRKTGAANTPPVLSATARVTVQLDERETLTRADLALKSEGGPTALWTLLLPPGATVKLAKEDEPKLQSSTETKQPFASLRTIRLKEPVNELNVTVTVAIHGPLPRVGTGLSVGPFVLEKALRQSGEITVSSSLQNVQLECRPHGEVESTGPNTFRYTSVKLPEKPQGPPPLLDVEVRGKRGGVETLVQHVLTLGHNERGLVWRVRTTIDATPFGAGVDHLDVLLPPDWVYDAARGPSPATVEVDPMARPLRFTKLASDPLKPFKLTFEAEYQPLQQPVAENDKATFLLPKPLDTRDRGGQVTLKNENEHLELLPLEQPSALTPIGVLEPQLQVWRSEHLPERIEVAWQTYKPKIGVSSVADLTLTPHEGRVRQTFRFHFPRSPAQVTLYFPEAIAGRWKIVRGGNPAPTADKAVWLVKLVTPDKDDGHLLLLEYTFPLPADADTLTIPLATPKEITVGENKVRVWSELGVVPSLASGAWTETDIEAVENQVSLPVLVAHAPRFDAPLSLRFGDGGTAAVLSERVLVRVEVGADGVQTYRVRYLLTPLGTDHLDLEFPAPVPSLNLRVLHDRVAVTPETVDESGKPADGSRIARLKLGSRRVRKPSVLYVEYQLQALRTGSGQLHTALQPPVLRGDLGRPTTRWQVTLADGANLLVLGPEGGPGAGPSWARRGWLFGPTPDIDSRDLYRWFSGGQEPPSGEANEGASEVTATCWRQGVEPLTVVHVSRRYWLLTCSVPFLVVGLLLFLLARRSDGSQTTLAGWFWGFLSLLPVVVLAGLFFWPTPAAAILYGCVPGVLVLLLAITLFLLLQERQRRQIVFLPSFRRGGSSLLREPKGSSARHGEPSTVDVPRQQSSQWPAGEILNTESSSGPV